MIKCTLLSMFLLVILSSCSRSHNTAPQTANPAMLGCHQVADYPEATWWEEAIYDTVREYVKEEVNLK